MDADLRVISIDIKVARRSSHQLGWMDAALLGIAASGESVFGPRCSGDTGVRVVIEGGLDGVRIFICVRA